MGLRQIAFSDPPIPFDTLFSGYLDFPDAGTKWLRLRFINR